MKKIIILLFIFYVGSVFSQNSHIDSLLSVLEKTKIDTSKVLLLNEIADFIKISNNEKALEYAKQAINIGKKSDFKRGLAIVYKTTGIIYFFRGDIDNAFENFDLSLNIYQDIGDLNGAAGSYINKGIIYKNIRKTGKAHESFKKALKIYHEIEDKEGTALAYLNIGQLHRKEGNYRGALENLLKSRKLYEETKNKIKIAEVYKTIGVIHGDRNEIDDALLNFNKALDLYEELDNVRGQTDIYNNLGTIHYDGKEYKKAIEYFNKSLNIFVEIGYTSKIALLYYNIGDANNKLQRYKEAKSFFDRSLKIYKKIDEEKGKALCYNGLGEYFFYNGDFKTASKYLEKAKKISNKSDIGTYKEAVEWLSKTYAGLGNYKKAYLNHIIFKQLHDSIFSENNAKVLTTMSMQYEFEKQMAIDKLQHKEEIQRQQIYTYASILGFCFMIFIAIILIRGNQRKKKANKILRIQKDEIEYQKIELESQNEEILAQRDEIETKNIVITEQRDIAQKQNKEITGSINYAKRIQKAVLPIRNIFADGISDYFILFKPRDIVSGDFYWMTKIENSFIIAAADCTGHGVPGAFMSMLGVAFLNEIITKDKTMQANEILEKLRERVIKSLHQTGKANESKDGMDIALCIINTKNETLQFAGAYNPLFLIMNKTSENERINELNKNPRTKIHKFLDNKKLVEIKGDRMPIGIYTIKEKMFQNNILKYKKGDTIYIFSDGYIDQFGGSKGRKLKSGKFREILMSIQDKQMQEQKKFLVNYYNEWKNKIDQLDDILIIGLRL